MNSISFRFNPVFKSRWLFKKKNSAFWLFQKIKYRPLNYDELLQQDVPDLNHENLRNLFETAQKRVFYFILCDLCHQWVQSQRKKRSSLHYKVFFLLFCTIYVHLLSPSMRSLLRGSHVSQLPVCYIPDNCSQSCSFNVETSTFLTEKNNAEDKIDNFSLMKMNKKIIS